RGGLDELRDRQPARLDRDPVGGDLAFGHRPGDRVVGRVEQVGVGDLVLGLGKARAGYGHQGGSGDQLENSTTLHATVSFWMAGCSSERNSLTNFSRCVSRSR